MVSAGCRRAFAAAEARPANVGIIARACAIRVSGLGAMLGSGFSRTVMAIRVDFAAKAAQQDGA
jgi:hypothetical protein